MNYSITVEDYAVHTPFGIGSDVLWKNLIENKSAIKTCSRFNVDNMITDKCSHLDFEYSEDSYIWQLIAPIQEQIINWNADYLIFATTKGEIDLLEKACRNKNNNAPKLLDTLNKTLKILNIPNGSLISAACASSNIAIAQAAEKIVRGSAKRIVVLGIDILSKFVYSGFSALQALTSNKSNAPSKPFDVARNGLVLGEAAAAILISKQKNKGKGKIVAWGSASDANHVTGPARDGSGLFNAITQALNMGGIAKSNIAGISAHGTGTKYNDAMEIQAFSSIFQPLPIFSIKGALGHTMGASGVLESIIALQAIEKNIIPPTYGFINGEEFSSACVSSNLKKMNGSYILKTNSGFGGINAALIFTPF